jgi:hypothetical protein
VLSTTPMASAPENTQTSSSGAATATKSEMCPAVALGGGEIDSPETKRPTSSGYA